MNRLNGGRMNRLNMAAAGIAALLIATAGCGQQHAPQGAGRSPAPVNCVRPTLAGRAKVFSITQQDNGKTYCVTVGTGILVFLRGTLTRKWAPIHPGSGAIAPRPSGMMSLAIGVTGGFFRALHPGEATLTSVRSPCHAAGTGCPPGSSFKVTVLVSAAKG